MVLSCDCIFEILYCIFEILYSGGSVTVLFVLFVLVLFVFSWTRDVVWYKNWYKKDKKDKNWYKKDNNWYKKDKKDKKDKNWYKKDKNKDKKEI